MKTVHNSIPFPNKPSGAGRLKDIFTRQFHKFMSNMVRSMVVEPEPGIDMMYNAAGQFIGTGYLVHHGKDGNDFRIPAVPSTVWSGLVWFHGGLMWDFNRVDADPYEEALTYGMWGRTSNGVYEGSVGGEWLKINKSTGDYDWIDDADFSDDYDENGGDYEYFRVALKNGTWYTPFFNRVSGDIRVGASGGGGSMGTWSGMVWVLGQLKYDFSRVDADPEGEELDPPGIAVGGVYLVIDLLTQDYSWTSTLPLGPDGYAHKNYYPVGVELPLPSVGFSLSSDRVVGDIRIDMVPYYAPLEEELPSAPPPT